MTNAKTDETGRRSLDPKHAPVPLPPGSVDFDTLTKGLSKAVNGATDKREGNVVAAIKEASGIDLAVDVDPSDQPGFKTVEVEHETIDGLTETLRVFDPKEAKAAEAATTDGTAPKNEGE